MLLQVILVLLLTLFGAESKKDTVPEREKCETIVLPSPDDPKIIYYQLLGDVNSTHYVWGLQDVPVLFMSVTGPSSKCISSKDFNATINWDKFSCNGTHNFCVPPTCSNTSTYCNKACNFGSLNITGQDGEFAFAIAFNSLVEFFDRESDANKAFDPKKWGRTDLYHNFSLLDLDWTLKGDQLTGKSSKFKWNIKINVPIDEGRLDYFPKTLYTVNSTTFDFVFQNFPYTFIHNSDGNFSRLVLEATLIHGNLSNGELTSHFSRDDEYTPSIFLTYNYLFGIRNTLFQGFLQWKPIAYLSKDRKSTKSEQINLVPGGNVESVPYGLASALFNNCTSTNNTRVFLVMGTEGDDNNPNPDYVTWTGMLGYGDVPEDKISLIVITTIAVGLGIPLILIIFGSVYVAVKKKFWEKCKKTGYSKMKNEQDEDDIIKENGGKSYNED